MTKCVIYTRVSTAAQSETGVSLDAQLAAARAHAQAHGLEIIGEFCDAGISGKSTKNRPEFKKALELVCKEKVALVFYSLSRISRSTRDLLDISERVKKAGAGLVSIKDQIDTSTAMGDFLFTLLAALCALERALIGERTSSALAHKRENGEKTGGAVPYGFSSTVNADGKKVLVENEEEMKTILAMMVMRHHGKSSAAIAKHLNSHRVPTRSSGTTRTYKDGSKRLSSGLWSSKVVAGIIMQETRRREAK